jgi:hypothetical protein
MTIEDSASRWNEVLVNEFAKESDRAAVILTAAIFDEVLETLLKKRLAPASSESDEVFRSNGAAAELSSKIVLSYRLGLISSSFRRDLDLVRRIRNDFAHDIQGCTFESPAVRSRVLELSKSSGLLDRCKPIRDLIPPGTRHDFLFVASWMLHALSQNLEGVKPIPEAPLEFGYKYSATEVEVEEIRSELLERKGDAADPSSEG